MHFRTILFVDLPQTTPDPEWESSILYAQERIKKEQGTEKPFGSVLLGLYLSRLVNIQTAFGRELKPVVEEAMERFYCDTEDPRYRVFEDRTDEYIERYEKKTDCVALADGSIIEADCYSFRRDFLIRDGKVFQKCAGQLKHPKRTKKAQKMKVLSGYPIKKLFASFEDFVESWGGCKNEETGRYGEWYNPDAVYDWYSVGGRWPEMFLIRSDCQEYSLGEKNPLQSFENAPDGYRWVACARKKDIQWDAMRQYYKKDLEAFFDRMETMWSTGNTSDTPYFITAEGIRSWNGLIYRRDQTLEEFMTLHGYSESWKYPINIRGIFIEEEYRSGDDFKDEWNDELDNCIDDVDDDTVLVGIDYHM